MKLTRKIMDDFYLFLFRTGFSEDDNMALDMENAMFFIKDQLEALGTDAYTKQDVLNAMEAAGSSKGAEIVCSEIRRRILNDN